MGEPLTEDRRRRLNCVVEDYGYPEGWVRSAVMLLKERVNEYHKEPYDSVWDAVVNRYEQDIQRLIDECFPVFKED